MSSNGKRKLAAIMFTDMVGFTRANQDDEELALELLAEQQEIVRNILADYSGREIKTIGDAFLVVFDSAVEAANCAVTIQTRMHERNQIVPPERIISLRIAIHVDDVLETTEDAYGDGVNIAARIQSLAPKGGVCFSEQAIAHLKNKIDFQIRKLGNRKLKGVRDTICIFRIVFPWEAFEHGVWFPQIFSWLADRFQPLRMVWDPKLPSLYAFTIAGIAIAIGIIYATTFKKTNSPTRGLASIQMDGVQEKSQRKWIDSKWEYALAEENTLLSDYKVVRSKNWQGFDALRPWAYMNDLSGRFWLRKRFAADANFKHPALVLGLIQGTHRVYLNGSFIGGGDHYRDLMYYSFDNNLLKTPPKTNELLVLVDAPERIIPGMLILPRIGSFIDEFSKVRKTVWRTSSMNYHLKRTIYLVLSLLFAFACFVYYLHHHRSRIYLYFTLILLSGSLALLYGNSIVHSSLSFPFHRFLNFQSLMLSSALLFSSFLAVSRVPYLEVANNFLMILATIVSAALLLPGEMLPSDFSFKYQELFSITSIYTSLWVFTAAYITIIQFHQRLVRQTPGMGRLDYQLVLLASGFLTAMINFSATWTGFSFLSITRDMQSFLSEIGIGFPLVFSLGIGLLMLLEHSENSQQIEYRIKRDELVLKILRIVNRSPDLIESLASIQQLVCDFVGAKRSTLYLFDETIEDSNDQSTRVLRAHHAIGTKEQVEAVREHIPSKEGLIGYVTKYKSPVLVRDFRHEPKYQKMLRERPSERLYESTSCIVIPLIIQQKLNGVLTVADKQGKGSFTEQDFFVLNNFSRDLALIIHNATASEADRRRIQELEQKLEDVIKELSA